MAIPPTAKAVGILAIQFMKAKGINGNYWIEVKKHKKGKPYTLSGISVTVGDAGNFAKGILISGEDWDKIKKSV